MPNNPASPLGIGVDALCRTGTQIVQDYSLGPENSFFFYAGAGIIDASVPQSDDAQAMPLQVGKWSAQIGDYDSGGPANADVTMYLRQTIDGQFHGGVLDVNVFLVDGVASQDQLKETIAEAYSDYVGLGLGQLNFYSLPEQYDIIDETNFYAALNETKVVLEQARAQRALREPARGGARRRRGRELRPAGLGGGARVERERHHRDVLRRPLRQDDPPAARGGRLRRAVPHDGV